MTRMKPTLAFALVTAVCVPAAFAQSGDTTQKQQATQTTQTDAVVREQLLTTNAPVAEQLDETRPPPVNAIEEEEEEAMRRDRRPPRADERRAADPVDTQRVMWSELDTNGDGRISAAEGEADADFRSNFEMMDSDRDGYVSDAEYRTHERGTDDPRNDEAGGVDPARTDD